MAGELSTSAKLGLWIFDESRHLLYTSCPHEKEFCSIFELNGGFDFVASHKEGCRVPAYFSDSMELVWVMEHTFGEDAPNCLVLLGPMFISTTSEKSIEESLKSMDISLHNRRQLERILRTVPVVLYTMLEQYARMLHYMITLTSCPDEQLSFERPELAALKEESEGTKSGKKTDREGNFAVDADRETKGEKLILKAVQDGNRDFMHIMETEINFGGQLLSRTGNTLRDGKNTVIIFNALCSRSAINGGLSHAQHARSKRCISCVLKNAEPLQSLQP